MQTLNAPNALNDKPHPLVGKWEVEGIYQYLEDESKWVYVEKYEPGYMIWELAADGKLSAWLDGKSGYDTQYTYIEGSQELLIALYYLEVIRVHNIQHIDRYRVEIIDPEQEVWLYNLEDVIREPQDYWIGYKLKRIRA